MHALPSLKSRRPLKNWSLALFCCVLASALLGRATAAWAQASGLSVTITRPSEGETYYAGQTTILYSTPIVGIVSSDNFDPQEIEVQLAIYQDGRQVNLLRTTPTADGGFTFSVTVNPEGSSEQFTPDILHCATQCHFKSEVALPPGSVQLVVTATDPAGNRAESERHITVDISRQAVVPVHVTLEGQSGQSLAGIPVSGSTRLYLWRARNHAAETDATGGALVTVEALAEAPTRYTFRVEPSVVNGVLYESVASAETVLPPGASTGEPVNLTVSATMGQITGELSGAALLGSEPLAIAAIRLPSGSIHLTTASAEGNFVFEEMAIDRYVLAVDDADLIEQGLFIANQPANLTENIQTNVQMTVQPLSGESLKGAVLDADGRPLPFAWVTVGDRVESVLPVSGEYLFSPLPGKTNSLIATAPGYYSQAKVFDTSPGAVGELEVKLTQHPDTQRVVWGSGEVLVPADSDVEVEDDQFILKRGWLWGEGNAAEPIRISAGSATIAIKNGAFALDYRPNLRSWFYLLAGEASVSTADDTPPLQMEADQMINLWLGDLARNDLEVVPYNPLVVTAFQTPYSSSPVSQVWEPGLGAQIRDRLARIGIGTAQIVTFITYLLGVLSIVVVPLLALYWRWRRSRSAVELLRSGK